MLQANLNSSVLTVSPPESGFSPRPEFARDSHVPSSFALFAIAGSGGVRLSSFSKQLVDALASVFQSQNLLRGVRQEPSLKLIEFNLDGKPWAQRKSIDSEKLFVQILSIIFQHGYRFLSTIDYGREHSERVSIAFSRPAILSAYEASRIPFALSFPSSRVLRVINPPLNSSPAILQAARTAWPRGVVSEKKVSEKCFEFQLKGYRWFQEDTFSTDSMQHILALLNALDRHAFTLLTSISLSGNHSRVKDLWIFSGSHIDPSSDQVAHGSNTELPRGLTPPGSSNALSPVWTSSSHGNNHSVDTLHGKSSSLQGSSPQGSSHTLGHARSVTEPNTSGLGRSPSVLRKKSPPRPLGSLPSSPFSRSSEEFPIRGHQLSTIGSVDMTGIGSANQRNLVTARTNDVVRSPSPRGVPRSLIESDLKTNYYPPRPNDGRVKTGELFYETGPIVTSRVRRSSLPVDIENLRTTCYSPPADSGSESRHSSTRFSRDSSAPLGEVPQDVSERVMSDAGSLTPPILGSRVFRDSALSSSTNRSCEIPIKWTGAPDGERESDSSPLFYTRGPMGREGSSPETDEGYGGSIENGQLPVQRPSPAPKFPGAWQPTPIVEMPEDQGGLASPAINRAVYVEPEQSPERKEVHAERVASPMLSDTPGATRKSEVALYGIATKPTLAAVEEPFRSPNRASSPTKTDGWVLVSVADSGTDQRASRSSNERPKSSSVAKPIVNGQPDSSKQTSSSLSPIAKAIAVEDARKARKNEAQQTPGLRRLFSGSRPKPRQSSEAALSNVRSAEERTRKPSLRDRWRKKVSA